MTRITNRRRAERILLPEPLSAKFATADVYILDIGLLGALIEHTDPLPVDANEAPLMFSFGGSEVIILSRVARTAVVNGTRQTGIEFIDALGQSASVLRELIYLHVSRFIAEQKANARGERSLFDADGSTPFLSDEHAAPTRYLSYSYGAAAQWRFFESGAALQPIDGFTVEASTPAEEIALLKSSYEKADPAGRDMIRAIAELSITRNDRNVPPKKLKKPSPES